VGFFKDNAIVNAIKVIGGTLLSGILVPIQGLLEILSHIPRLGHLAGKGAEKIQEFRNFLKGVDGATVTADVNMPDKVAAEFSPSTGTSFPATPDYGAMGYSGGAALGAGGRSKLHGVVDVLGGSIPSIPGAETVRAATSGADAAANSGIPETLTRTGFEIAAILRKIDVSVSEIAQSVFPPMSIPGADTTRMATSGADAAANSGIPETLTRTGFEIAAILRKIDVSVASIAQSVFPRITMNGDGGDTPEYISPRNIAPITQAERTAYNYSERMERLIIEVAAENGTSARIVRAPRDAKIALVHSGGNA
jgi:hypothetical protein